MRLARWLADRGAQSLILAGRSAPSEEACRQLEALGKAGVRVAIRKCDVGNRAEVATLLAGIGGELPPLRGIFHLAGVLDDGVLREQTRERFDRVLASKAIGAWYLHELARDLPLDFSFCFPRPPPSSARPDKATMPLRMRSWTPSPIIAAGRSGPP